METLVLKVTKAEKKGDTLGDDALYEPNLQNDFSKKRHEIVIRFRDNIRHTVVFVKGDGKHGVNYYDSLKRVSLIIIEEPNGEIIFFGDRLKISLDEIVAQLRLVEKSMNNNDLLIPFLSLYSKGKMEGWNYNSTGEVELCDNKSTKLNLSKIEQIICSNLKLQINNK